MTDENKYTASTLGAMNKKDLAAILLNDFGVVPSDGDQKNDLIDSILRLQDADTTASDDGLSLDSSLDNDEEEETTVAAKPKANKPDPEGRTWIKIANDEHDTNDVFLSTGGDACSLKRERWAKVKNKFILGPLNDAVQTLYKNGKAYTKRRFNVTVWSGAGDPVEDADSDDQMLTPLMG